MPSGGGIHRISSKTHEIVSRSKTELWHRILTHYLPLYFPEAERFHRSSRTDWLDLSDYQLLTIIHGVVPINAMIILAEAGDLRRFRHHRQYLKLCGMDLATVQSGMFRGQSRI